MEQDPIYASTNKSLQRRNRRLTHVALRKPILIDLVLTLGMKVWIADIILEYSTFRFVFAHFGPSQYPSQIGRLITSVWKIQMGVYNLGTPGLHSVTCVTDYTKCGRGPSSHD